MNWFDRKLRKIMPGNTKAIQIQIFSLDFSKLDKYLTRKIN